jgi:hypothetical protein
MANIHHAGHAEVRRAVAATPTVVWGLVADVTRMGEWSPETTRAAWTVGGGGPAVGARFTGWNQRGSKTWSSTCTVTACELGRSFAFDVAVGPFSVAHWSYDVEPTEDGCLVTERWQDRRGAIVTWLSPAITGTRDRAARNRETMAVTLERLAAAAQQA